jgi:ABC-type polysaccharide/polyol phosphate export permease
LIKNFFAALWKTRRLVTVWTKYNIQANYLDTKLGAVWLILQPILMTIVYSLVFSFILDRRPRGGVPFINFFFVGLVPWLFFNNSIFRSTNIIFQKANMISQIKFPRETLVFVLFSENFVDFTVNCLIMILLNAINGYFPNITYVYIPLLLFTFFSISLGAMFILASIGLFIRDTTQVIGVILRLAFYFSGIIFPADMIPERAVQVLQLNPVFFVVESFRGIVLYAESPDVLTMVIWLIVGLSLLIGGYAFFDTKSGVFADYQ